MISLRPSRVTPLVLATVCSCAFPTGTALADPHDGTGTMTVSPAIVNIGSASNSFVFTFLESSPGNFPNNSVFTIAVPATWTCPQTTNSSSPGYVSALVIGGDTIHPPAVSGSGPWTISVTFKGHNPTSGFNVTYAGGGSEITAPASAGVNTIAAQSQGGPSGTLTSIAVSPSITVVDPNLPQILQRGSAATATGRSTNLVINKPAGVLAGDVMIVNIEAKGNQVVPSLAGWTPIAYAPIESGAATHHGAVLYRVADASDTSATNYTFNLGPAATGGSGAIVAYSGVNTTGGFLVGGAAGGPFDVAPGNWTTNISGSTAITGVTAITRTTPNAAVLMFVVAFDNANSVSGFSAASLGSLASNYSFANANGTVGAGWTFGPAVGSTGTGSATLGASQKWGAILLALRPLVVSVTETNVGLTIMNLGSGSYRLNGAGVAGRIYRIQCTGSLSPQSWQTLPSGSVTADGSGNFQYIDTSTSGMRFYRAIYP